MRRALLSANRTLLQQIGENPQRLGAATTIVMRPLRKIDSSFPISATVAPI